MTTLEAQAAWHEEQAKEWDDHADHYVRTVDTEDQDDRLIDSWRSDAARHRASAAAMRMLELHTRAIVDRLYVYPRDSRGLISDPAVLSQLEAIAKAQEELAERLSEIPQ